MRSFSIVVLTSFLVAAVSATAGAADASPGIPQPGIEIPADRAAALTKEIQRLKEQMSHVRAKLAPAEQALLPDVEVFIKAVDYAVRGRELYHPRELGWAEEQLKLADERLRQLSEKVHPWTQSQGLVVRGFRSKLDDSVQPYGLVIPEDLDFAQPSPLYVWLHGRGDQALDVQFIHQRLTSAGQIQPAGAIVLHPYARFCNGYKSAGEVDVFEAIEATCAAYNIDRDRIVLCGFSMGGAGVWHLGAHYADRWAAMSPGAGFVDVRRYQNLTPDKLPPWYEQTLWGVYDVPDYVRNLLNVPLVAYSGELDKQKAAADLMEDSLKQEGLTMTHIVGPGVAHKYEPAALADVLAQLQKFEQQGLDHHPASIHFQTRTLRYHRCHWVDVLGLEEHWRDARVDATRQGSDRVDVTTKDVTRLRLSSPWNEVPSTAATLAIDGTTIDIPPAAWTAGVLLEKATGGWRRVDDASAADVGLAKTPGLQGPIDDALQKPFLVVRPTGKAAHAAVGNWVNEELARFRERWRTHFRGDVREVDDRDLTDEQMAQYNLLLWGDPASNSVIAKIANQLPLQWDSKTIRTPEKSWPADSHALVMIYPNPLPVGRGHYIVLNSGMTFREAHDRTNSLQNPKLPDWVVLDLAVSPNFESAGGVADAAFFDEQWRYQTKRANPGDPSPAAMSDAERAVRTIPDKISGTFTGGELIELRVRDRMAYIVKPTGKVDPQRRWLWEFPFWLGINDGFGNLQHRNYVEQALAAGFHLAGVDVGPSCASPKAADVCQDFHTRLVSEFGLNQRARIMGQSHGGLIAYGWAFRHPDCVERIIGICPATDFRSWPKLPNVINFPAPGLGYELTLAELDKRTAEFNPIDNLAPLAKSGVTILHLHGDKDELVPMDANSTEMARRYREQGGTAEIVVIEGLGHGGQELYQSDALVNFLLAE